MVFQDYLVKNHYINTQECLLTMLINQEDMFADCEEQVFRIHRT